MGDDLTIAVFLGVLAALLVRDVVKWVVLAILSQF
jgi:hypothetical protein